MIRILETLCFVAAIGLCVLMVYLATVAPAETALRLGLFTAQQLTDVSQ